MTNNQYIRGDIHRPNYKGTMKQEFFDQRETFKDGLTGFEAEEKALSERKALFEKEQKQLLAELHVKAMYEIDGKDIDFVDSKADIPVFEDERAFQIADSRMTYMKQYENEYTRAEQDAIRSEYDVLKAERDAFNSQYSLMIREEAMKRYEDALLQSRINEELKGEEKLFPIVDTRSNEELAKDSFNESFDE